MEDIVMFKKKDRVAVLTDRKDANWVYYQINQDMEKWARSIIDITLAELDRSPISMQDRKKIRKLVSRTESGTCP